MAYPLDAEELPQSADSVLHAHLRFGSRHPLISTRRGLNGPRQGHSRLQRRPRHLGHGAVDRREIQPGRGRLHRRPRPGRGHRAHPPEGAQDRGRGRRRHRRPQPVRRLFRLAGADGRGHLRGQVPAGHRAGPAADRQADGRCRPRAQGQGGRPRLHRQGQRPGALRRDLPDAGPGFEDHRSGARVEDDAATRRSSSPPSTASRSRRPRKAPTAST